MLAAVLLSSSFPVPARAEGGDIGVDEIVLTMLASMNMGIVDSATLTAIHNALGFAAESATVAQINNGLNVVASQIDLGGIFATTAGQAQELLATGTDGWTTLAGGAATAAAASGAENIAASIATWKATGVLAPAVGGLTTVLSGVAVVGAGAGLGYAINKLQNIIANYILQGSTEPGQWLRSFTYGFDYIDRVNVNSSPYYLGNNNIKLLYVYKTMTDAVGTYRQYYIINNTGSSIQVREYSKNGTQTGNLGSLANGGIHTYSTKIYLDNAQRFYNPRGGQEIPADTNLNTLVGPNISIATVARPSDQYVTGDGNAKVEVGPNGPELPGLSPTFDPSINVIQPIPIEKFQETADEAQNNNDNDIDNDELIRTLIQPYLNPVINADGIPNQPNITPKPVYTPIPTVSPYPTIAPEQNDENLKGQISGLENIFPFCIPWDLAKMFGALKATRRAPHIHWEASFGSWGTLGEVDIDMSQWDSVAAVCRQFEFILFCVGLAMITRNIIRG